MRAAVGCGSRAWNGSTSAADGTRSRGRRPRGGGRTQAELSGTGTGRHATRRGRFRSARCRLPGARAPTPGGDGSGLRVTRGSQRPGRRWDKAAPASFGAGVDQAENTAPNTRSAAALVVDVSAATCETLKRFFERYAF